MKVKVHIETLDATYPRVVSIEARHVERATINGHAAIRFDIRRSDVRRVPSDALNPVMLLPVSRVISGMQHVTNADSYNARRDALLASLGVKR